MGGGEWEGNQSELVDWPLDELPCGVYGYVLLRACYSERRMTRVREQPKSKARSIEMRHFVEGVVEVVVQLDGDAAWGAFAAVRGQIPL